MRSFAFLCLTLFGLVINSSAALAETACRFGTGEVQTVLDSKAPSVDSVIDESQDEKTRSLQARLKLKDGTSLEMSMGDCDSYYAILEWSGFKKPAPKTPDQWLGLLEAKLKSAPLSPVGEKIFDRALVALAKRNPKKKLEKDSTGWTTIAEENDWLCLAGWSEKKLGLQVQCKRPGESVR